MKYFWKKGYTQAMGTATTKAIAIRTDSWGMFRFRSVTVPSRAVGFLVRYSRLFCMEFSMAWRLLRLSLVMYSWAWNQSFQ